MKCGILHYLLGACVASSVVSANKLHSQGNGEEERLSERLKRNVNEDTSYFFYQHPEYPRDCQEVSEQCNGELIDGLHLIQPDGYPEPFAVYCNNTVDGGNWMVIQRRLDGSVDFNRYWDDYKNGFGFPNRELWLGNEKLAYVTNQKDYEVRFDFVSKSGDPYFAKYNLFRVSDEGTKYKLVGLGDYDTSSTVGHDSFSYNRGMAFSTRDRDNDLDSSRHCGDRFRNGWWFNACSNTHPNYPWSNGPHWHNFPGGTYNIQYIEIKIRPV